MEPFTDTKNNLIHSFYNNIYDEIFIKTTGTETDIIIS